MTVVINMHKPPSYS